MQPDIAARLKIGHRSEAPLYAVVSRAAARWSPPGLRNVLYRATFTSGLDGPKLLVPANPNRVGLKWAVPPYVPNTELERFLFSYGYPAHDNNFGLNAFYVGVPFQNGNVFNVTDVPNPDSGTVAINDVWVFPNQNFVSSGFAVAACYEQVLAVERDADL